MDKVPAARSDGVRSAPKRSGARAQGVRGVKAMISTLALVVTLSGWARLATGKHVLPSDTQAMTAPVPVQASVQDRGVVRYRVAPMPTLVPLIAQQHVSARRSPALAQPAPASAAPSLDTLRMVSAPPPAPVQAPVAVSRSSR